MEPFFQAYIALWAAACLAALILFLRLIGYAAIFAMPAIAALLMFVL